MSGLIFGVSGVRGIVNSSFFSQDSLAIGNSFGSFISGNIVLGRDTRRTGDLIINAFISGFLSSGHSIVNLGIVPTPTVLLNTSLLGMDGGAVVTASHNPYEWNGLKFNGREGTFLSEDDVVELYDIYNKGDFHAVGWDKVGVCERDEEGVSRHIDRILGLVDVGKIRDRCFRVIFDGCGGALSNPAKRLLKSLGCEVRLIYPDRDPEPLSSNLNEISEACKSGDFDVGFASDLDGDRIAVVTDEGKVPGEEYTLPLALSQVLKSKKGKVVTNLSTSKMVEYVAGDSVERTKVGETNVVKRMKDVDAVFGGEGNGGVIWPDMHMTRDGLSAISLILEYMVYEKQTISELIGRLPSLHIKKEKVEEPGEVDLERLAEYLPAGRLNYDDGLRVDFEEGFIHIRRSNTEHIIRIICETDKEETCDILIKKARTLLIKD